MEQNILNIIMLSPRGFCAGVERAVLTVEAALEKFGAPIYVKHQIVHNRNIVENFKKRGVIFVNNLSDVPKDKILIFNAHGVTKEFEEEVIANNITYIDATCPLVKKVHNEGISHQNQGYNIIIIGHKNHPEVIATTSRITQPAIIIETIQDVEQFNPIPAANYAYITQTTLSVDIINQIVDSLQNKIPNLKHSKSICYATQNRQNAIKEVIHTVDGLIIAGSVNSSNSNRLKEIGSNYGVKSYLIDNADDLPLDEIAKMKTIAISAGASSPEYVIENIISAICNKVVSKITPMVTLTENIKFLLPKLLRK